MSLCCRTNSLEKRFCFIRIAFVFVCFPLMHLFICSTYTTYVCLSVITHQVHSGGGVTQGHADRSGCVSDNPMIHPLQSDFIFFCLPKGPDALSD